MFLKLNIYDTNYDLSNKITKSLCFSKSYSVIIKFSIMLNEQCKNYIAKNI